MRLILPKKKPVPQATPSMDTLPVTPETLECIYGEVLNDLNRRTLDGFLEGANPDMLTRVQKAQAGVDKTWQERLAGKASLEDFRLAVKAWHGAVIVLFASPQAQVPLLQERLLNP